MDTSNLEAGAASDVKTFVARESQPGQLLGRLTWKITEDCAGADAVIRVYFVPIELHVTLTNDVLRGQRAPLEQVDQATQAVLLIYDRASVRLLYRTEGQGGGEKRGAPLKVAFSKLVKNMKAFNR